MSKHYLGCTYAVPNEAGLASEAKAVGRRLAKLLDALSDINAHVIEQGDLTNLCVNFRYDLIQNLKTDGWRVSIPRNNYKVLPPKELKR